MKSRLTKGLVIYCVITLLCSACDLFLPATSLLPAVDTPSQSSTVGLATPAAPMTTVTPLGSKAEDLSASTSVPTLAKGIIEQRLPRLIEENIFCDLACWWETYPGITQWSEVAEKLADLGSSPKSLYDSYSTHYSIQKESTNIRIEIEYLLDGETINAIYVGTSETRNNRLKFEGEIYQVGFQNYRISSIFTTLGPPDIINVRTYPSAIEDGTTPTYVVVQYDDQGIALIYSGEYTGSFDQGESNPKVCFDQTTVDLMVWSPDLSNMTQVKQGFSNLLVSPDEYNFYRPVKQALGYEIEEFYDVVVKNIGNDPCFVITEKTWLP